MQPSTASSQQVGSAGVGKPLLDPSRLARVLDDYKNQKGAIIPILQRTQDIYGYLPKEAIHYIANRTRIPLSKIHGIATFYSQFHLKRRGRNLIRVCDGTACHVRGAGRNLDALKRVVGIEPGETSPDYRLTLEVVYCLGSCGIAPVALVNETVCGRLNPETLVQRAKALT